MEIWHRVGFCDLDNVDDSLRAIGVKYDQTPGPSGYIITLEITESDPRWPDIKQLIREVQLRVPGRTPFNFVWTEYTRNEVLAAEWLQIAAVREIGYAEPQRGGAWHRMTFEGGCSRCSVGERQIAPYRIKREPRLRKRVFATLYNNFPLFCTSEVLEALEAAQIRGFETWPVLLNRTGEPSALLRQVIVPTVAQPALVEELAETERFRKEVCPVCGQVRYTFYNRGMMPMRRGSLATDVDLQLTHEWFGSLYAAQRQILVSNRVARVIVEHGWKDIVLWPVQLV